MNIIRDRENGTAVFTPADEAEALTIASMLQLLSPREEIVYGGRDDQDGATVIYLHVGSVEEEITEETGNILLTTTQHLGGVELTLVGSTDKDREIVGSLRDIIFFGSGGLIFLEPVMVGDQQSMKITGSLCKHCGGTMLSLVECEWKTCNACAAKCHHVYEIGAIHGGGTDIGVGKFCGKCGRVEKKPDEDRDRSQLEQHLEAIRELGIHIQYPEQPPGLRTPTEVISHKRTVRRLVSSRSRRGLSPLPL